MDKKFIWFLDGGWSPASISGLVSYWDNGDSYMSSDALTWTDRIGGITMTATGSGHSRSTGINGKLKLVNTSSGNWAGARMTTIQGLAGLTIWVVGKNASFQHYFSTSLKSGLYQFTGDNKFYGLIGNGSNQNGSWQGLTNTNYYAVLVFDGGGATNDDKMKMWVNADSKTLTFTGTLPALTESNASSIPTIGKAAAGVLVGEHYEIGVVNRAITSDEVTSLNSFLASRYGL